MADLGLVLLLNPPHAMALLEALTGKAPALDAHIELFNVEP